MYREWLAPVDLRGEVECVWERVGGGRPVLIVPDACIDLIWLEDRELVIAGPDTRPRTTGLAAERRSSGLRLRPGVAGAFLGLPASELVDCQPTAEDIFGAAGRRLGDQLAAACPPERRRLLAAAARRRHLSPDVLVMEAATRLAQPGARVSMVAAELGVSERQLHRRAVAAVGYGPKMLARVLRLRRLSSMSGTTLADRAFAAGYASQAHMSDEVRMLTGTSASRYLV